MRDYNYLQSGFTLLEVIAALSIFVVSLGSIYLAFDASVSRASQAVARSEAIAVAQSVLSASLANAGFESASGEVGAYRWDITYEAQTTTPDNRLPWQLYIIDTTVSWERGAGTESLTLVTKRIGFIGGG